MPTLTAAIRTDLIAATAITAVVVKRIRGQVLDEGETMPAVRINVVSGTGEEHLGGASTVAHATVQIDAYASTPDASEALADLIRVRLCPGAGRRGLIGNLNVHGISVQSGPVQTKEPVDDGGNHFRFVTTRDFRVAYTQAIA